MSAIHVTEMWILQESCTILRHASEAQKSQQFWYKLGFSEQFAADNTLISPHWEELPLSRVSVTMDITDTA